MRARLSVSALALLFLFGCAGNEALRVNVEVARAMLEAQSASGPVIRDLRIDAALDAARAVHDAGGDESEALESARATADRWSCAIDGHRLYSGAEFQLIDVVPFVRAALDAYRSIASCLQALGVANVPEEPAFFQLIPPEWSLPE